METTQLGYELHICNVWYCKENIEQNKTSSLLLSQRVSHIKSQQSKANKENVKKKKNTLVT